MLAAAPLLNQSVCWPGLQRRVAVDVCQILVNAIHTGNRSQAHGICTQLPCCSHRIRVFVGIKTSVAPKTFRGPRALQILGKRESMYFGMDLTLYISGAC